MEMSAVGEDMEVCQSANAIAKQKNAKANAETNVNTNANISVNTNTYKYKYQVFSVFTSGGGDQQCGQH